MVGGAGGARRQPTCHDAGRGEEITDAEPDDCAVAPAGRWIVDPDGAVVRAGLVRHYAARHGLWQLDPDIAYLSGDRLPDGVRGFEVLEVLGFSEKRLRQALSARDAARSRSWFAVSTSTPTRSVRGCGCVAHSRCPWSSPGSAPGPQVGQRHSSADRHDDV